MTRSMCAHLIVQNARRLKKQYGKGSWKATRTEMDHKPSQSKHRKARKKRHG